jgi:hypothetical protein
LKKIKFAFGIHNHQPIGNFDFVFEEACQNSYFPFIEILKKHPGFKLSFHFSGILFDWIKKHFPEKMDEIKDLVKKGQVEMMTGAYNEPILPVIPDWDKIGQIKKLTEFIEEEFQTKPNGMWLAERVWEPHLPKPISLAGVKFVVLDDTHFKYSGLKEKELLGYYVTEEQGYTLNLFPISKTLRYFIPFREPEATIDYLRGLATEQGDSLVVYADDGEKFGLWPNTYKHCYEDGWIEKFFSEMERNSNWIEMIHFSEALKQLPPLGRVYLPTASYYEMMQWSLPFDSFREFEEFEHILKEKELYQRFGVFVRGGFWRNFLAKYPEANHLHKKVLWISEKIKKLEEKKEIDPFKLKKAQEELWKGECNCPYWHGVFGGLYLNHLRSALYQHLIESEKLLDEITHSDKNWIEHFVFDFDKDGKEEIIINTPNLNLCFSPQIGGTLYELDFKPGSFNLLDTLTRREEGYHNKLVDLKNQTKNNNSIASIHDVVLSKEKGLEKYLTYDWYRRGSFIDHFIGKDCKLENFVRCSYPEQGDFVNQPYLAKVENGKNSLTLTLYRDGFVWVNGKKAPITLAKKFSLKAEDSQIQVNYFLMNNHSDPIELWFGIEFNFSMLSGDDETKYYYMKHVPKHELKNKKLNSIGEIEDISDFGIKDEELKLDINLKIDKPADLWRFPIQTVSLSEGGFERVYQSSVLFPHWKINLKPEESWEVKITKSINQI